ncbi:MAG: hydantoinase/oxoprolinase family protein, partial [Mesorhizobium sp.]
MTAKQSPLFLGIDTGGTYTDAVLWSEEGGPLDNPNKGKVLAKAKALTTRHDLAVGISGAVDAVLEKAGTDPAAIKLV